MLYKLQIMSNANTNLKLLKSSTILSIIFDLNILTSVVNIMNTLFFLTPVTLNEIVTTLYVQYTSMMQVMQLAGNILISYQNWQKK